MFITGQSSAKISQKFGKSQKFGEGLLTTAEEHDRWSQVRQRPRKSSASPGRLIALKISANSPTTTELGDSSAFTLPIHVSHGLNRSSSFR